MPIVVGVLEARVDETHHDGLGRSTITGEAKAIAHDHRARLVVQRRGELGVEDGSMN